MQTPAPETGRAGSRPRAPFERKAGRRGQGEDIAARATLLPGRDGSWQHARADPAPPRSRNLVLITVESMGALYMDLYNPDARTMRFVSGLFNEYVLTGATRFGPGDALFASPAACGRTWAWTSPTLGQAASRALVPAELRRRHPQRLLHHVQRGDQRASQEVWSSRTL